MSIKGYNQTRDILLFEGRSSGPYWQRFAVLLAGSVIIATMGLLRNSGAVVIAAMLIAPLMTPILGIAAAMIMGWRRRVLILLGRVLLAALAAVILAWALVYLANVPRGLIIPSEVHARTDPGIEDLIVALAAGAAGAYVQVNRNELSLLPGAAIGVALVPPLSAAGILLYFGEFQNGREAVLLFMTNLAAIILAACAVYLATGNRKTILRRSKRRATFTASFSVISLIVVGLVLQLSDATVQRYRENRTAEVIASTVADWSGDTSVEILRLTVRERRKVIDLWLIIDLPVDTVSQGGGLVDLLPETLKQDRLVDRLSTELGPDYTVAIRFQPRFAGLVQLSRTGTVTDAPAVGEIRNDEEVPAQDGEADRVISPEAQ